MKSFYHWIEQNGRLCAWAHSANVYFPIATIHEKRAVNQMLAYSRLGEDIEHLADKVVAGSLSSEQATIKMVELVRRTIEVTI